MMKHWNLVLPPSRPSADQLQRIKFILKSVDRSSPVGVLGSTPEFRDLLYECGFLKIYVLEKNSNFYRAMSSLRIYHNPEVLVEGDWLEILLRFKNTFSAILSDLTSGNVPYSERKQFYDLITQSLVGGGFFIDKVLTHIAPNILINDLIEKYSTLPLNLLYVNYFSCEILFCSELLDSHQLIDTTSFYLTLEGLVRNDRVRKFVENAKLITPEGCKWWYGKMWNQLKADYCENLKIISAEDDHPLSPYYGRLKHFTLKKGDDEGDVGK